jgi:hypothetical protein
MAAARISSTADIVSIQQISAPPAFKPSRLLVKRSNRVVLGQRPERHEQLARSAHRAGHDTRAARRHRPLLAQSPRRAG